MVKFQFPLLNGFRCMLLTKCRHVQRATNGRTTYAADHSTLIFTSRVQGNEGNLFIKQGKERSHGTIIQGFVQQCVQQEKARIDEERQKKCNDLQKRRHRAELSQYIALTHS